MNAKKCGYIYFCAVAGFNQLELNIDYYIENGRYVFTADYLKKRGHCCGSRCRHCPYKPKHRRGNKSL
jgi:Family of unknown function (DUF5522)